MRLHDAVVGHVPQRQTWDALRRTGRIPHALLLAGVPGIGKRLWALAAAQDLLCEHPSLEGACGTCAACRDAARGSHPDLLAAEPADGRLYHAQADHDEVSPLLSWLSRTPARGARKVLVLDKAEGLLHGEGQASDAALKLLEEPPAGTHLLLVSAGSRSMSPTILSRCVRLFFPPLSRADFRKVMGARDTETLFRLSRGSPGEAMHLLEAGLLEAREALAALPGGRRAGALAASEALLPPKPKGKRAEAGAAKPQEVRRREALDRLQMLAALVRDRLPGLPAASRLHPDLASAPPLTDPDRATRALLRAQEAVRGNADLQLALEACAVRLAV